MDEKTHLPKLPPGIFRPKPIYQTPFFMNMNSTEGNGKQLSLCEQRKQKLRLKSEEESDRIYMKVLEESKKMAERDLHEKAMKALKKSKNFKLEKEKRKADMYMLRNITKNAESSLKMKLTRKFLKDEQRNSVVSEKYTIIKNTAGK